MLSLINDAFRHYAPRLRLWSFYETLPMKAGLFNKLVVDKHSSTLGYDNEEIAAMGADHRHVCKFESPEDPNYIMLRNALGAAVELITDPPPATDLSSLREFLYIGADHDYDLERLDKLKAPGTCNWFTRRPDFESWSSNNGPTIFWMIGRPTTGKSVLASHVAGTLASTGKRCSYYFFKSTDETSTLSYCLRSIALQTAIQDDLVASQLKSVVASTLSWDRRNILSVWKSLFVNGIFKEPSIKDHFWILDDFTHCLDFRDLFAKDLFVRLPPAIHIFATSPPSEEIKRGLSSLEPRVNLYTLSEIDTASDMKLLMDNKLIRFNSADDRELLSRKILCSSAGSFLWIKLVLERLEHTWSVEAIDEILSEVSVGLYGVHSEITRSIAAHKAGASLAKTKLSWVSLASRPLSLDEIKAAVKLYLGQTLLATEKSVPDICGHLLFVDSNNFVHMIHGSVRDFLFSDSAPSQLAVRGAKLIATSLLFFFSTCHPKF